MKTHILGFSETGVENNMCQLQHLKVCVNCSLQSTQVSQKCTVPYFSRKIRATTFSRQRYSADGSEIYIFGIPVQLFVLFPLITHKLQMHKA